MRTLLSQFCEEFEHIIRPLLAPLNRSAQTLSGASADLPGREIRAELTDLRHQMEVLVDKVAEQKAYVLIFGPLKSGKSTLMNGLSASYVSEVSSLPAYPCMVYLSHSPSRRYEVTRYGGEAEVFTDPAALYMHVNRAHTELAERLRMAEEQEQEFDPAFHFPQAIRKIDVKLPAGDLAQSGAVLVDTPGLYSRMKFGYDRMTREFRNAAACAIFVVKSDNLFLEQVFEEFSSLLELFSRIFLVVNLDTSKRDLGPNGDLVPSLEQEDPLRIIDAFENLVMGAPLKRAADEGRLRIYPVDLLRAASCRLKGSGEEQDDVEFRGQANFDAFLKDLTDYLNSTDYLMAFLGDSLRRASSLLAEIDALKSHAATDKLTRSVAELESERKETQRCQQATERLESRDWKLMFAELDEKLSPDIKLHAREAAEKTERAVDAVLDEWFRTDASLQSLVDDQLTPLFFEFQGGLSEFVQRSLDDRVALGTAGVRLPTEVAADLRAAQLDLSDVGRLALERVDREGLAKQVPVPLRSETIPVRKRFLDWLLFRSRASVRQRLFGPTNAPSLRIPADQKQDRLGQAGKDAIRRELDAYKASFFEETLERMNARVVGDYSRAAVDHIRARLTERRKDFDAKFTRIEGRLKEHRKVLDHLTALQKDALVAKGSIDELSNRYGQTDPDLLIQPVANQKLPEPPKAGLVGPEASTEAAPTPEVEVE